MTTINLSGAWRGQYFYPIKIEPVVFTAQIQETESLINGDFTEIAEDKRLNSIINGFRNDQIISFIKLYDNSDYDFDEVHYKGEVSSDCNRIEGIWTIPQIWSGNFVMTRETSRSIAKPLELRVKLKG